MSINFRASLPLFDETNTDAAEVIGVNAPVSRRGFLSASAIAAVTAAFVAACGGGADTVAAPTAGPPPPTTPPAPPTGSVSYTGGILTVNLDAAPTLAAANGFLVASVADPSRGRAEVIVINLGAEGFRAFTSVCTHQGCTVSDFTNGRIRCPCHGSEFDKSGSAVVGPASSPLKEYRTAVDTVRRIISVTVA